jgi:hypothetical protein
MIGKTILLQVALVAFEVGMCLLCPLSIVWPSAWAWHSGLPKPRTNYDDRRPLFHAQGISDHGGEEPARARVHVAIMAS